MHKMKRLEEKCSALAERRSGQSRTGKSWSPRFHWAKTFKTWVWGVFENVHEQFQRENARVRQDGNTSASQAPPGLQHDRCIAQHDAGKEGGCALFRPARKALKRGFSGRGEKLGQEGQVG